MAKVDDGADAEGVEPGESSSHNTALEVTWTVIPVGIVLVIFYWGFTGYMDLRTPPSNAYDIRVAAKKLLIYNGEIAEEVLRKIRKDLDDTTR